MNQAPSMTVLLARLIQEDNGQDLIEYSLLAIVIALAAIGGMNAIATGLNLQFTNINTTLSGGS